MRFVGLGLASFVVAGLAFWAGPAAAQADRLSRGAYLVNVAGACGNCHTPKGPQGDLPGRGLAGGMVFEEPVFRAVAPNITPDPETGIGRWTDAQIATAIREGRRPNGTIIGPPMPIELYRGISDEDVAAMVAYLRTVPPVVNRVEPSRYDIPLPASYGPPITEPVPGPANDAISRGAYLAGPIAHCTECHTPMGAGGQRDWSQIGAGGQIFSGPWGSAAAANITPTGLGRVEDSLILRAITRGIAFDGTPLRPPMGYAYYAGLSQQDQEDLLAWLRSLPPR
ncbi:c-type cytochrome [Muricoccus radiodurans]|uniref:c-type cytochrome n=1 Tax=Muricoccus radiodurans TaxID=2231721 RepID=UPI003CFA7BAD